MLYYIVVTVGAATLAGWFIKVICYLDEGGGRK